MKRYNVPRLIFINKLDRLGADPQMAINGARDRLGLNAAAVQVNIGIENGLQGVVDLVRWKAAYFDGEKGEVVREEEVPADMIDKCKAKKLELISCLAECGEEKMEEYFLEENWDVPEAELKECIRRNTISCKFAPVYMGSAYKNKGVQKLLDGVIDYLPNPREVKNIAYDIIKDGEKTIMEIQEKKPFVGLAFKLEETKFGQVTYVRIYQGKIKKGQMIINTSTNKKVKVSRMVRMHSAEMEDINEAGPGDIFALFGVDCASGETFCDIDVKY